VLLPSGPDTRVRKERRGGRGVGEPDERILLLVGKEGKRRK